MKTPLLLLGFLLAPALRAADAIPPPAPLSADDVQFFESKIRPLLATHCHACHTGGALGNLRLDSREGVLKGGKSGKVVVEGKPEANDGDLGGTISEVA